MLLILVLSLVNHLFSVSGLPSKHGSDDFAKKYLVTDLPGLYKNIPQDEIPLMFSGQLELDNETETSYFFWKFEDNNKIFQNRTTFWLNGGPGCSSMDGAFLETGPFRINSNQEVVWNNGSWHKMSDMVYVDQPGGTGFSYTQDYLHDLDQVSDYFLKFLNQYFKVFPNEIDNDIYFAGESYAGQYIPYIAKGIVERNKNLKQGESRYNLKGLLIGNGWVSPNEQSLSYLPYFIEKKLIDSSNPNWLHILRSHEDCQKIVNKIDSTFKDGQLHEYEVDSGVCENILNELLKSTVTDSQCINIYDYKLRDSYPSCGMNWPLELAYVKPFLNKEEVHHKLNLNVEKNWVECNGRVGRNFKARNSIPAVHLLPDLLQEMPIILFNGANDIVCNSAGVLSYIKKLKWNEKTGFENEDLHIDWKYDNSSVGFIIEERNLSFINIENSSHMVPYDIPEVSRALFDIITKNYKREETQGKISYLTNPINYDMSPLPTLSNSTVTPTGLNSTTTTTPSSEPTGSKITRLIQLGVILIVLWGIYILYSSYKSRPSSIIKKPKKSNRKKKNVQWSDQLDNYEDGPGSPSQKKGFFTKFFSNSDTKYNRIDDNDYTDNIELNENLDDFLIESDEEDNTRNDDRIV